MQKLIELKGKNDKSTVITDLYMPLPATDKNYLAENEQEYERTQQPHQPKYLILSCTHGRYTNIDHYLDHKTKLNHFKKIDVI